MRFLTGSSRAPSIRQGGRLLLLLAAIGGSGSSGDAIAQNRPAPPPIDGDRRPHVLLILADDLGVGDLGRHNPRVRTPHLDALAERSARFTDFHVHLKCAPTRASLLTGRHFLRTGVWGVHGGRDFLSLDETLLPQYFQNLGYDTAMVGKWHSGLGDGYYPWQRGFDQAYVSDLYRYTPQERARVSVNGQRVEPHETWAQQALADTAIRLLTQPRDRPLLLYLPLMSPHAPWRSPAGEQQPYLDRGDSPDLAALWGMVTFADRQIGRVLAAVEARAASDPRPTLVVFLSDNGPVGSGGPRPPGQPGPAYQLRAADWQQRNPMGWRGGKGQLWEGGLRSVLWVSCDPRVAPGDRGGLAVVEDLVPTLLEFAGSSPLASAPPLDGRSLSPLLQQPDSPEAQQLRRELDQRVVVWSGDAPTQTYDPWRPGRPQTFELVSKSTAPARFAFDQTDLAWRQGSRKWIRQGKDQGLFDLEDDPAERRPLDQPTLSDDAIGQARRWWSQLLREPMAFERPRLLIDGRDDGVPGVLQLRSATQSHGIQLTAHAAIGWDRVGDRLTLQTQVTHPGRFRIFLLGEAKTATRARFEVEFQRENADPLTLTAGVDRPLTTVAEHPVFGWQRDTALPLGEVALDTAGPWTLTVRLAELTADTPAVDRLDHLLLEHLPPTDAGGPDADHAK